MNITRETILRIRDRLDRAEQKAMLGEHKINSHLHRAVRVQADAVNTVKSDAAGTVFASTGDIKTNFSGVDWRCFVHLRYPLKWFSVFHFEYGGSSNSYCNIEVPNTSAMPTNVVVDLEIYPVLVEWDATTLTYTNMPTTLGQHETMRHEPVLAATMLATSSPSDYNVGSVVGASAFWGFDGYTPDEKEYAIYGFMIQPSVSGTAGYTYEYTADITTTASSNYAGMI